MPLGACEEVDEVAGGASGIGVDGIGEVGDQASEGDRLLGCMGQVLQRVLCREKKHGGDREQG